VDRPSNRSATTHHSNSGRHESRKQAGACCRYTVEWLQSGGAGSPASTELENAEQGATTISALAIKPAGLKRPLRSCGYRPDLLRSDFRYGDDASVPLVGFAQQPMDSRSACVAVLAANGEPRVAVETCRPLGTPLVFVCFRETLQWWKQGAASADWIESIPIDRIDDFFQSHQADFSPDSVYRAKTLGRVQNEYQLSFVDVGLMPLVEGRLGQDLSRLIERNVSGLKRRLDCAWAR
jgi:hypothetical protein